MYILYVQNQTFNFSSPIPIKKRRSNFIVFFKVREGRRASDFPKL